MGLASCGFGPTGELISERDAALAVVDRLEAELEIYRNGEPRLVALSETQFEEDDREAYRETVASLEAFHPQSEALELARARLIELEERDAADLARKEQEAKEAERIANLRNMGMWKVVPYTDEFGDITKDYFVRNTRRIAGSFNNSATRGSELAVILNIDSRNELDIRLYEYGGNNPVNVYSETKYLVQMIDSAGEQHSLQAINRSDRLSFGPRHSAVVHDALMRGGRLRFSITEDEDRRTRYRFDIQDATFFDNAMRMLAEKEP